MVARKSGRGLPHSRTLSRVTGNHRNTAMVIVTTNFLLSVRAQAQGGADEIPKLHPFHAEIPPTFWEQHGMMVLVTGLVLTILAGVLLWLLLRPRPPVVVPPEVQAREALAALPATGGDGAALSRVSQILRRYFRQAFGLPPVELTTTEFCRVLSDNPRIGPELAGALAEFLRDNDRRKFSPGGTPAATTWGAQSAAEAVARARALIEQGEARRAGLRAAQAASPSAHSPA
jgi:hypothetical protein